MARKWMLQATPEEVGVSSAVVLSYLKELEEMNCCMHGFCMIRHGQVFAEGYYKPFSKEGLHRMYSSSKSMVALAVGLLQDEGKIRLEDSICDYFKDRQPKEIHPWVRQTTIRDMLRMATCFVTSPYEMTDNSEHDWIRMTFECPPTHRPGQIFSYDTSVAMMLAALVEELSGMELMEYLRSRLAPLELSGEACCVKVPDGRSSWGGSGVLCTLRDFSKLALLSLNYGKWEDRQLISREYMEQAVSRQIETADYGYGYQFWMTSHGFAMRGMGGQMAYCMPEKDMVFVVTGGMQSMEDKIARTEELFYRRILAEASSEALPGNAKTCAALQAYCADLSVKPNKGARYSPVMERISGKKYKMIPNDETTQANLKLQKVSVEFEENEGIFTWDGNTLRFGLGHFVTQDFPGFSTAAEAEGIPPVVIWYEGVRPILHMPCIVSGAWQSESVLDLLCYGIGNFLATLKIRLAFEETAITVHMEKYAEKFWEELQGFQSGECLN